jgi:hypothetical protein
MIGFISVDATGLGKFKSELVFDNDETGADFGAGATGLAAGGAAGMVDLLIGLVCTGADIKLPSASNSWPAGACGVAFGFLTGSAVGAGGIIPNFSNSSKSLFGTFGSFLKYFPAAAGL